MRWNDAPHDAACRVGVSRDAIDASGRTFFDPLALRLLDDHPGIAWEYLAEEAITAAALERYDVLCLAAPGITGETARGAAMRTRLVARFGVGYDHVDVPALTAAGTLLTINPDGVRRPVATAELAYVLALAHGMPLRDRQVRSGAWDRKLDHVGRGLTGRVLASLGLGNIGRELFRLAAPLAMRHLAHDPAAKPEDAAALGVELVAFDALFREADFLIVNCPLNAATRGLVDARALALLKPGAFLVNCARGPIVDEAALIDALRSGRLAGAGLDVLTDEPPRPDNPLLALDNVILSPHAMAYTDECLRGLAEGSFRAAIAFAERRVPPHVVNPAALEHAALRRWFARA